MAQNQNNQNKGQNISNMSFEDLKKKAREMGIQDVDNMSEDELRKAITQGE